MKLHRALHSKNAHRLVFNGQSYQTRWNDLLKQISNEWKELELKSVLEGIRECSLSPLTKREYAETLAWAGNNGLKVRLVRGVKRFEGFANYYEDGDDYYVTAVARTNEALAHPENNLGYPTCCTKFFEACYPTITDPIWQWATGPNAGTNTDVSVLASPFSDPTLRYQMVRFVPHIPCNPNCGGSIELGRRFSELMNPELRAARYELLSQPHSWDCYRSVAIVKTEPFRLVVGSAPAAERYVVNVNPR